jgi:hypothetical protein
MLLTKHDGQTFQNQAIYLSGQAFINCTFQQCTLILRDTVYHIDRCTFERCNWHIDKLLMWGNAEGIAELKTLTTMMETALQQQQAQMGEGSPFAGGGAVGGSGGGESTPPA